MAKRVTRLGGLLAAYQRRDPAARSKLEIFLLYPGVHAVLYHRVAHWLYRHHRFFLARCVSQWSRFWTGIEIHPGATIGHRLVIDLRALLQKPLRKGIRTDAWGLSAGHSCAEKAHPEKN